MTPEQIALQHGLCTCDPIYSSRGMKAPDCPWHAYEVEAAMEAYGRQEAKAEAIGFALWSDKNATQINADRWKTGIDNWFKAHTTAELYDLYLINKNKSDVKS